jgi:hypothetical protein
MPSLRKSDRVRITFSTVIPMYSAIPKYPGYVARC